MSSLSNNSIDNDINEKTALLSKENEKNNTVKNLNIYMLFVMVMKIIMLVKVN